MQVKPWWTLYGPFAPGVDDLPHMGQVISHYARLHGVSAEALAHMLTEHGWKVGRRRIEQLMSQHNADEPQHISRRRLLAHLLAIPPVLFGIADLAAKADLLLPLDPAQSAQSAQSAKIDLSSETLLRYERTLATYWDNFYSSSIQRHWPSLEQWCRHLEELHTATSGAQHTTVLAVWCRFEQLAAVTARDRLDLKTALRYHDHALLVASELGDAELLVAGLVRRARTYAKQGKLADALTDMKQAVPLSSRCRPNLRGYTLQAAAAVISQFPPAPDSTTQYQRLMEAAGRIIRTGHHEDDGSFVRLTAAGYHQDRARGLLRLGQHQEALSTIAAADTATPPHLIRWQAESAILRAHTYAQAGEIDWACSELENATRLVRATTSRGKKQKLTAVYDLIQTRGANQPTLRHLHGLLSE